MTQYRGAPQRRYLSANSCSQPAQVTGARGPGGQGVESISEELDTVRFYSGRFTTSPRARDDVSLCGEGMSVPIPGRRTQPPRAVSGCRWWEGYRIRLQEGYRATSGVVPCPRAPAHNSLITASHVLALYPPAAIRTPMSSPTPPYLPPTHPPTHPHTHSPCTPPPATSAASKSGVIE